MLWLLVNRSTTGALDLPKRRAQIFFSEARTQKIEREGPTTGTRNEKRRTFEKAYRYMSPLKMFSNRILLVLRDSRKLFNTTVFFLERGSKDLDYVKPRTEI